MCKKENIGAVAPKSAQRGITLIALVITIIVMLILVAVTISMAVNGGIFEYAGKAVGETNNAMQKEQQLANVGLEVGGVWYNSIDEYLATKGGAGGDTLPTYANANKENGYLTEKAMYTDTNNETAVIPKGFAVSSVATEQTINKGLVIRDENGNEFVWIPVEKAIVTEAEIAKIKEDNADITTDVKAVEKLVRSGIFPMAVQVGENYKGILYSFKGTDTLTATVYDWTSTTYREPVNLTAVAEETGYIYDSQEMFTLYGVGTYTDTLYQDSYNKMVNSVSDNGGFYVGRYEISSGTHTLEDGSTVTYAQSKQNQTILVYTEWYNMYKYERNYAKYNTNLGVTSEMIWGSQWDQMMIFVNDKEDGAESPAPFYVTANGSRQSGNRSTKTGMNSVDQVANIFDLEAGRQEWTQEGRSPRDHRTLRGGHYTTTSSTSSRSVTGNPDSKYDNYSSRIALYIKY